MPTRTSLITGKKYEQNELLRFTLQNGEILFDEKIKNPGRGGYVENTPNLIEKIKSPKLKGKVQHFLRKK